MNRYLLNVSYIGTNFRGMQKTFNKLSESRVDINSVQGCIELALQVFRPVNEILTVVSSRTDSGVHALDSTLHVDLQRYDSQPYDTTTFTGVLNRTLDKQHVPIRILKTQIVPDAFHCRFNATGRTYVYRIALAKYHTDAKAELKNKSFEEFLPIEEYDRCYFIHEREFNIERVRSAASLFVGRHDFRTFMSTSRQKSAHYNHPMFTVRVIDEVNIKPGKSLAFGANATKAEEIYNYWDIEIKAKSFLYKQVRRIVGSLVAVGAGRITEKCIKEMLTVPSKNSWKSCIMLAPACGLYLCKELQQKRHRLKTTETILTTSTGDRFIECKYGNGSNIKLETSTYGFVVDTKPDKEAACILDDFLFLGSQDAVNIKNLKQLQLSHVLSVGIEMPFLNDDDVAMRLQNLYLPCLDVPDFNLVKQFPIANEFISTAAQNHGRILVHCNAGVSRSASIVIAYLMQTQKLSFNSAFSVVKAKRACIQPNAGFVRQLKEFEIQLEEN